MNVIAKNIKKLRERKGLTQEELGEKLHVTRQAVSNWETGKNQPDIETLTSLAAVLEVEIQEVLYGPYSYEEQRKKKRVAACLCIMTAIAWGIYFPLLKYAEHMLREFYVNWPGYLCQVVINPVAFFLLGAAISSLLTLRKKDYPLRLVVGRNVLIAVVLFCLLYGWSALNMFWAVPIPRRLFLFFVNIIWWKNNWIFLPIGILAFFSINAVETQKRKSG